MLKPTDDLLALYLPENPDTATPIEMLKMGFVLAISAPEDRLDKAIETLDQFIEINIQAENFTREEVRIIRNEIEAKVTEISTDRPNLY